MIAAISVFIFLLSTPGNDAQTLLETITHLHKFWELSFYITAKGTTTGWSRIIDSSDVENADVYGSRIPSVSFKPGKRL